MNRKRPNLLSQQEQKELLEFSERLFADLQNNKLGGYSGVNRPFWIKFAFEQVIEKFGKRDVGLNWSQDDLEKENK